MAGDYLSQGETVMPELIPTPAVPVVPVTAPVVVESTDDDLTPGADALGDAGKKALDAMKAKWKAAEAKAQTEADARATLEARIAGTEAEHAAEQERRTAETAAQVKADARANERILKAEIRAVASKALADPADALKFLDLSKFEVSEDGDVDTETIKAAIADLIKSKPYLAAQGGPSPVFESPGAHRNGAPAGQLTGDDVKKLYAEKKYGEIEAARAAGRLTTFLSTPH
jgi:hypothetical protein